MDIADQKNFIWYRVKSFLAICLTLFATDASAQDSDGDTVPDALGGFGTLPDGKPGEQLSHTTRFPAKCKTVRFQSLTRFYTYRFQQLKGV